MSKADFRSLQIYDHYLIVPVQCERSGLWTASWLDEDNFLQIQGGTPLDFSFRTPEEAICALKRVLKQYSSSEWKMSYGN